MDSDLKQDETDAQVAAKKAQAERDAAEAKRQADNKAAAAALAAGKPAPETTDKGQPRHTRISATAASMRKHFEAFSAANLEAFKEINKLSADADGALTDGNFLSAQEIVKHLRALTAGQIEAARIPADVPTGGLHANSGLAGGRVDPAADNLHDYQAGRISVVSQY